MQQSALQLDPVFKHLNMPPTLACNLLGVFARAEYALKGAGFVRSDHGAAQPNWDAFAKAIANKFDPSKDQELQKAVNYLLTHPPQKQVLNNNSLEFSDVPPNQNDSKAQQVLSMVRRVRNNLFHGGKFLPVPQGDPDRDNLLIQHSLSVLRACILLEKQVYNVYRK